jgi:hypothetical protein
LVSSEFEPEFALLSSRAVALSEDAFLPVVDSFAVLTGLATPLRSRVLMLSERPEVLPVSSGSPLRVPLPLAGFFCFCFLPNMLKDSVWLGPFFAGAFDLLEELPGECADTETCEGADVSRAF